MAAALTVARPMALAAVLHNICTCHASISSSNVAWISPLPQLPTSPIRLDSRCMFVGGLSIRWPYKKSSYVQQQHPPLARRPLKLCPTPTADTASSTLSFSRVLPFCAKFNRNAGIPPLRFTVPWVIPTRAKKYVSQSHFSRPQL